MSLKYIILVLCVATVVVADRKGFLLDERWVCGVKSSCFDCLKLPHCSWCDAETKCYSKQLPHYSCKNETIDHVDYGFSLKDNAECSCSSAQMEVNCYPPGVSEGPVCSGRGTCVCGYCVCDPTPDPEYPTKVVMGEYCEFDNFSCEGPRCNEGPYSLMAQARLLIPMAMDDSVIETGNDDTDDKNIDETDNIDDV